MSIDDFDSPPHRGMQSTRHFMFEINEWEKKTGKVWHEHLATERKKKEAATQGALPLFETVK